MIFDYETLKLIWWLFVGVLLVGFAITDGFDLGIGALLPFLGKNDDERRVIINSIGANLGRQPGLVHHRRRRHFRGVASRLCHGFFRFLHGADADAVCAVLPAGRVRLPQQGRRSTLALCLGLGVVCGWFRACR